MAAAPVTVYRVEPLDETTQSVRVVPGYRQTALRNPALLQRRPLTRPLDKPRIEIDADHARPPLGKRLRQPAARAADVQYALASNIAGHREMLQVEAAPDALLWIPGDVAQMRARVHYDAEFCAKQYYELYEHVRS